MKEYLSSKIHKATVTEANLEYEGSITIDGALMDKAGLEAGQKVLVASNTTGQRLETYVIEGEKGSGVMCINGAGAHLVKQGEELIIMGFEYNETPVELKSILVNKDNVFVKYL